MTRTRRRLIGWAVALAFLLVMCAAAAGADRPHTTPVVVRVQRDGFRWSDAGVGALAGVGLSLVVCGCLALARLRDAESIPAARGDQQ